MTPPLDRRTFLKGTAAAAAGLAVPGALAGCAAGPGVARPGTAAAPMSAASRSALPVRLDMVHFNPGEPPTVSSFNDPEKLAAYGYTGKVVNDFQFVSAAVTFDSFDRRVFPAGSDERAWVEALARSVDAEVAACHAAGVEAVFWMDVVVLPKRLVELYGDELTDAEGRLSIRRPRTQEVQRALIAEVFERFPGIDGLCVRTGETYLDAVPPPHGRPPDPRRGRGRRAGWVVRRPPGRGPRAPARAPARRGLREAREAADLPDVGVGRVPHRPRVLPRRRRAGRTAPAPPAVGQAHRGRLPPDDAREPDARDRPARPGRRGPVPAGVRGEGGAPELRRRRRHRRVRGERPGRGRRRPRRPLAPRAPGPAAVSGSLDVEPRRRLGRPAPARGRAPGVGAVVRPQRLRPLALGARHGPGRGRRVRRLHAQSARALGGRRRPVPPDRPRLGARRRPGALEPARPGPRVVDAGRVHERARAPRRAGRAPERAVGRPDRDV